MATRAARFAVKLWQANGKNPLTGYYVSIVRQSDSTVYDLTEDGTNKGMYYLDSVEAGVYDLYKDTSANPDETPGYKDPVLQNIEFLVPDDGIDTDQLADRSVSAMKAQRYVQKKVEVTGTPGSPQTFTSGSGDLATPDEGGSYPAFTAVPCVEIFSPYQDAIIFLANTPTVSANNVTFDLAISDFESGSPANYYCDIVITNID